MRVNFNKLKGVVSQKYDHLIFCVFIFAVSYYCVLFSLVTALNQIGFQYGAYDMSYYDQAIWFMSNFMLPYNTLAGGIIFSGHASFYTIFLAPLFWLWSDPIVLLIVQTLCLALAAIPIFLFAKKRLENSFLALAVGISYLLYPAMQNMNMDNFHPEVLAILPLSLTLYFLMAKNYKLFYIFSILSILGKEEICLVILFFGIYILFVQKQTKPAITTMLMGIGSFIFIFKIFLPSMNGYIPFISQAPISSHWFQGLLNNLFNINYYVTNFLAADSIKYYLSLFTPVAFIPFLGIGLLFTALPSISLNVLSGVGYLKSINYHYDYVQAAIIFFAMTEGLYVINKLPIRNKTVNFIKNLTIFLVIFGFAISQNNLLSRLPLRDHFKAIPAGFEKINSEIVKVEYEILELTPKDAKVSVSYTLFAHFAHRKDAYMFPNPYVGHYWGQYYEPGKGLPSPKGLIEYIVLDWGVTGKDEKLIAETLINSNYYQVIYKKGPFIVLQYIPSATSANNYGLNYIVYNTAKLVSINDDFKSTLSIKETGVFSMPYFPQSKFYFRNLLGEETKSGIPSALELFGYYYIPKSGQYGFSIRTNAQYLITVDGKPINGFQYLNQGFHEFKIKYLNKDALAGFEIIVEPANSLAYIPSDKDFLQTYDQRVFNTIINERQTAERKLQENIINAPNLLLNSGFEDQTKKLPSNWVLGSWRDKEIGFYYTLDNNVKKSGAFSGRFINSSLGVSRWMQIVSVEADTSYLLSGWIMTKGVSEGAGACLFIEGLCIRTDPVFGTNDWKYFEVKGRTGLNQKWIEIQCRLGDYGTSSCGTVYFDDIVLKKSP